MRVIPYTGISASNLSVSVSKYTTRKACLVVGRDSAGSARYSKLATSRSVVVLLTRGR